MINGVPTIVSSTLMAKMAIINTSTTLIMRENGSGIANWPNAQRITQKISPSTISQISKFKSDPTVIASNMVLVF